MVRPMFLRKSYTESVPAEAVSGNSTVVKHWQHALFVTACSKGSSGSRDVGVSQNVPLFMEASMHIKSGFRGPPSKVPQREC